MPSSSRSLSNSDDESEVDEEKPSCDGHGTYEALQAVRILQDVNIPCCVGGTAALIFYGAGRIRNHWEICVPADLLKQAEDTLLSQPPDDSFITSPTSLPQPRSLVHTYPHLKHPRTRTFFILVPAEDIHLDVRTLHVQHSSNGLPYPRLETLVQSFLDSSDILSLCDVIDGTDVSEEWGCQNLDLSGFTDTVWLSKISQRIRDSLEQQCVERPSGPAPPERISTRTLWKKMVTTKKARMGWTHPSVVLATRFRLKGSRDPWLTHRSCS